MRILSSIRNYVFGSFFLGWTLLDRLRIFYYQTKSYFNRFILKGKSSNKILSVKIKNGPVYFRDNWFDSRNLPAVFENDYLFLDKMIFSNCNVFVDVGANIGLISRSLRLVSPTCKIFCFEPLEENAKICKLNNPDATVEVCGVGSKPGITKLLVDECGFMASRIPFGYKQIPREIKVISLDDYFKTNQSIDLLKIDVEGMELEVLKGAQKTLNRTTRVVAEVHSDKLLQEFREIMSKHNFKEDKLHLLEKETYAVVFSRLG